MTEPVQLSELLEDALRMDATSLERHDIQTIREFDPKMPPINTDKHKVLQILVNLIRNAKHACAESGKPAKRLIVRVSNGDGRACRLRPVYGGRIPGGVAVVSPHDGRYYCSSRSLPAGPELRPGAKNFSRS